MNRPWYLCRKGISFVSTLKGIKAGKLLNSASCLAVLFLVFTNACTSEIVKYDPIKDGPIHNMSEDRTCYPSGRSLYMIHRADNQQSGYRAFHKFCKNCHHRGEDAKARYLTMESKSREGWDAVFDKRMVSCAKDGTWDSLTELQMWNLRDYLFTTAAGLEDPRDEWKAYECPQDWRQQVKESAPDAKK